jgi:serine/threonine protein kinase
MNRPLSSSKLGDFEIVRPLGEGGFGDVFEARARDTRLRVALKIIRDPLKRQAGEFLKEALFCNVVRERSPFVPQVVAAGVDEQTQRPWIAVEYIEGVTLEALMRGVRRKGMPWAWSEAREILYCVVHALRCAHEVHLVHCDIKPSNVMVARSSTPERRWIAYVLDFGVARLRSDLSKHATATAACSPAWASPEQLEARGVTPKSDQWSFALLVFWTLVGETFPLTERQRRSAVQWAQWHGVSLPPAFDAWFARATQASPDHRFADIDRAWEALEQIFARNIPAQQPVPSAVPRHPQCHGLRSKARPNLARRPERSPRSLYEPPRRPRDDHRSADASRCSRCLPSRSRSASHRSTPTAMIAARMFELFLLRL